ncbi:MAG: nucleoside phosphorylase [Bacteroidota bacterium]
MQFPPSELIINPDGSIYHLHLRPEDIANTIITVGDPNRVPKVSKYFDHLDFKAERREFVTHTGRLGNKRLTVISTGIGPDNIDIVLNELDALANIDFASRTLKPQKTQLRFIRIGTTGGLSTSLPLDTIVASAFGIGLDNLLPFYDYDKKLEAGGLRQFFNTFTKTHWQLPIEGYAFMGSDYLLTHLAKEIHQGITLTCPGFYAPQGRHLRAPALLTPDKLSQLDQFQYRGLHITNFEMETAAIYGLSRLLGHQAISFSTILANRLEETFSADPAKSVDKLIRTVLRNIYEWEE